jgi:hypothetical protein
VKISFLNRVTLRELKAMGRFFLIDLVRKWSPRCDLQVALLVSVLVCSTSRCNGPPCVRLLREVLPMHNNRRVIVAVQKVTLD